MYSELFEIITDLHFYLHAGKQTDAVFIIFDKAFDYVPHSLPLVNSSNDMIDPLVVIWISAFPVGGLSRLPLTTVYHTKPPQRLLYPNKAFLVNNYFLHIFYF